MEVPKRVGYAPLLNDIGIDGLVADNDRRWTQERDLDKQCLFDNRRGKKNDVIGRLCLPTPRGRCDMQNIAGCGDK